MSDRCCKRVTLCLSTIFSGSSVSLPSMKVVVIRQQFIVKLVVSYSSLRTHRWLNQNFIFLTYSPVLMNSLCQCMYTFTLTRIKYLLPPEKVIQIINFSSLEHTSVSSLRYDYLSIPYASCYPLLKKAFPHGMAF